jgi:hypothetical protein
VLHKEVPPAIVKLAHDEMLGLRYARQIIFAANIADELLKGHMAVYIRETESIVVDLAACVKDLRWMDKGATFIANAWFNLLYCIFHETRHAMQEEDVNFEEMTDTQRDEDADEWALEGMVEWCSNNPLPKMEQMEYIGERIREVLNAMWAKHASIVENEIECNGVAAAKAMLAAQRNRRNPAPATKMHPGAVDEPTALMTAIREGFVESIMVGNEPCIGAGDFLEMGRNL